MRVLSSLITNILGVFCVLLVLVSFVVCFAEALHALLPWIYEDYLWIGTWIV
jgi:hypothetical protein